MQKPTTSTPTTTATTTNNNNIQYFLPQTGGRLEKLEVVDSDGKARAKGGAVVGTCDRRGAGNTGDGGLPDQPACFKAELVWGGGGGGGGGGRGVTTRLLAFLTIRQA